MELTYLFHSGFVLTTDSACLVFDCWLDPAGVVRRLIADGSGRHVYVFASHFHEDHFSRDIFAWRTEYPHIRFTYILSKDILKRRRAQKDEADAWLAKGGMWQDDYIRVTATGSNDSGVSWVVSVAGKTIFHAGDLCNWYARFLSDGAADESAYSAEFGTTVNPLAEEKRYLGELKDIRKVTDAFDLVMFPVDGRIGNGYTLGARQFMERFRVGVFVPMHFVMSGFESAWRLAPFCRERGVAFWCIGHEGESITLVGDTFVRRAANADERPAS